MYSTSFEDDAGSDLAPKRRCSDLQNIYALRYDFNIDYGINKAVFEVIVVIL